NWNGVINELEAALEVQPQNKRLRMQKLDALANARPPRWIEAESFLAETRQMPQFEKDADWMLAEATMWRNRRQYNKALAAVREALKIAPENPVLLSNYYDIL